MVVPTVFNPASEARKSAFLYNNIVNDNIWIDLNRNFSLAIMVNIWFSIAALTDIQHNTQLYNNAY